MDRVAKSATTFSLPRNKTGIFASEFQNNFNYKYVKYSSGHHLIRKLHESSAMTKFDEQARNLDFRKHSAFKITLKPRKTMAAVNTKLIEQQSRPQSRAAPSVIAAALISTTKAANTTATSKSTASLLSSSNENPNYSIEILPTNNNNESLASSSFNNNNDDTGAVTDDLVEVYMATKDSFRPSTVKKKKMPPPTTPFSRSTTTMTSSPHNKSSMSFHYNELLEPLNNRSPTPVFMKSTSDIYKEVVDSLEQQQQTTPRLSSRPTTMHYVNLNTENNVALHNNGQYRLGSSNTINLKSSISNMNEEEFLKVLKEYRQTKSIVINNNNNHNNNNNEDENNIDDEMSNNSYRRKLLQEAKHLEIKRPLLPPPPPPQPVQQQQQDNSKISYSYDSLKHILNTHLENPNNRAPKYYANYLNNKFERQQKVKRNDDDEHNSAISSFHPPTMQERLKSSMHLINKYQHHQQQQRSKTVMNLTVATPPPPPLPPQNKMRTFHFPEMAN